MRTATDVAALRVPDPHESTPYVLDAIRLMRHELPAGVPLIGFAGAPFTMATYLVEGGGTKSVRRDQAAAVRRPDAAHALLSTCAETVGRYLAAQVEAGAQAAMLFDTWAALLAPGDYREFALPYVRRVFDAVAARGCRAPGRDVPRIYYAGNAAGWLDACADAGATVIGLDWRLDLDRARARARGRLWRSRAISIRRCCSGPPTNIRSRRGGRDSPRRTRSATSSISVTGSCPTHRLITPRYLVDAVRSFRRRGPHDAGLDFDSLVSLIRRYDRPGPRYTSYPTAVEFSDAFRRERRTGRSSPRWPRDDARRSRSTCTCRSARSAARSAAAR